MQKKHFALIMAAGACIAGCQNEDVITQENGGNNTLKANAVSFMPAGFGEFDDNRGESPESRTAFTSGKKDDEGKWVAELSWVHGDMVRIYCEQASEPAGKAADYKIEWTNGTDGQVQGTQNSAFLTNADGNPLCWGNAAETHTFYSFYPASAVTDDASRAAGIVTAEIPKLQELKWEHDEDKMNWEGEPDMQYAYMRAITEVAPEQVGQPVEIHFKPLTTAVQIELKAASALNGGSAFVTQVRLTATTDEGEAQTLCGNFELDLTTGDVKLTDDRYADINTVTVSTIRDDGSPLEIKPNGTVKFTAFLLPGKKADGDRTINNLRISVDGFGAGGAWSAQTTKAIKVGTVNHITLTGYTTDAGAYEWMKALDDDVKLAQLSLPGSTNSYSNEIIGNYTYEGEGKAEMSLTQLMGVCPNMAAGENQFKSGVRVFEIATDEDLLLTAGGTNESGSNFNLNYTLENLSIVISAHKSEFAVVIPCYEPDAFNYTGVQQEQEDVWAQNLYNYLINHTVVNGIEIVPFDGRMTVGEARGKILLLSRIFGIEDSLHEALQRTGTVSEMLQHTSVIYNLDCDRDKWQRRGYGEDYGGDWRTLYWRLQWKGTEQPIRGSQDFQLQKWEFTANIGKDNSYPTYHVHEWRRVCKETGEYSHDRNTNYIGHWYATKWYESMTEKKQDATGMIDSAMEELNTDVSGESVYINSLGGFYIVSKSGGVSAAPYPEGETQSAGLHGDIPPYARDINKYVFEKINEKTYQDRGPLGIVLMNYAGTGYPSGTSMALQSVGDLYGDKLLQAIIDNNFRFPLKTESAE